MGWGGGALVADVRRQGDVAVLKVLRSLVDGQHARRVAHHFLRASHGEGRWGGDGCCWCCANPAARGAEPGHRRWPHARHHPQSAHRRAVWIEQGYTGSPVMCSAAVHHRRTNTAPTRKPALAERDSLRTKEKRRKSQEAMSCTVNQARPACEAHGNNHGV